MKGVSRRKFMTIGAAGIASAVGLGLAGCAPNGSESQSTSGQVASNIEWDEEADVVVLGFGGAGGAAAIEAADNGASVIVCEAYDMVGGATSLNQGVIQCAGSSVQKEAGFEDSSEKWLETLEWTLVNGYDKELLTAMTASGPDNIDWLLSLGAVIPAEFHDSDPRSIPSSGLYSCDSAFELHPEDGPMPRGHVVEGGGGGIIAALSNGAEARGISILTETRARRLIQNEEGRIIGVEAEQGNGSVFVHALKAVIVATGHFNENADMVDRHIPFVRALDTAVPSGHPCAYGDGHIMCASVGAELYNMNYATTNDFYLGNETGIRSMRINKACQRYWSEQGYHNGLRGARLQSQPDQLAFAVFDEGIRAQFDEVAVEDIAYSAESIRELAELCSLDPDALEASVARYNDCCAKGRDYEWGKDARFLVPIENPPYYASKLGYSWMTSGGMHINSEARVIDMNGQTIPGLFAAGMCAAGVKGYSSPCSGLNMMWNFYTGRLAGKTAAAEAV